MSDDKDKWQIFITGKRSDASFEYFAKHMERLPDLKIGTEFLDNETFRKVTKERMIEFQRDSSRSDSEVIKHIRVLFDKVSIAVEKGSPSPDAEVPSAPPVQETKVEPPRQAEGIILALMEKGAADALLGDLEETFHADIASGKSVSRANWRYWGQIARSLWPLIWEAAKRTGVLVAFVKLLG